MPTLRIVNSPMNRATYDATIARMDLDHVHPLGLIMHGATEVDGRMLIAQVWDSEEYLRKYTEERLNPALDALGQSLDFDSTVFELEHLVTP